TILAAAPPLLRKLPPLRVAELRGVLHDVAALAGEYTGQRALVLFSTLRENEDYLGHHRLPADGTDVVSDEGVLYREFSGHGLVFHPLGNFARLNNLVSAHQDEEAAQAAAALVARGIPGRAGSLRFEYEFPFSAGAPPWTSGMAQAVAAQALARAGDELGDSSLADAASAAYRAVPGLLLHLDAGPWIRLYDWSTTAVLNAQLQTSISLDSYGKTSGNAAAVTLAARMRDAAQRLLPRFDTGYWSLYDLDGSDASLSYHDYVITLLKRLAAQTGEQDWRNFADRFQAYETQPPILRAGAPAPEIYPDPQDGYKDEAPLKFWLSKLATVTLRVGKTTETLVLAGGWHELDWAPGAVAPGLYHPRLAATDQKGLRAAVALDPVTVRSDIVPPELHVAVAGRNVLFWSAEDPGTPWLQLVVVLSRGRKHQLVDLGQQELAGRAHLKLPKGRWHAVLYASNSAGRTRRLSLGLLPRPKPAAPVQPPG